MTDADDEEVKLLPLHRFPEYMEECMCILNYQWPRSETLRNRSLQSSCDQLPTSLVLIKRDGNNFKVLGHSRINAIPNDEFSVWIESVIIHQNFRGKGFGRMLMKMTENHAVTLGYNTSFLSTHDEQIFYSKLGYEFCPPICLYGGIVNRNLLPKQLCKNINTNIQCNKSLSCNNSVQMCANNNMQNDQCGQTLLEVIPPPPPPPPPLFKDKLKKSDIKRIEPSTNSKTFMKKWLIPF